MKRYVLILIAFIMVTNIMGCSSDHAENHPEAHSEPSKSSIKEDLQEQLNSYCTQSQSYPLDIKEFEVVKSLTEEKTYSAEIRVTTQSEYAHIFYTADVVYTLYDQGWYIDSCQWEMLGYEVVNYPSEQDIPNLPNSEYVTDLESLELHTERDSLKLTGINKIEWSPYVIGEENVTVVWQYYIDDDKWHYSYREQNDADYTLTSEFANAWNQNVRNLGGIVISNVNKTSFDISANNALYSLDSYHVELSDSKFESNKLCLTFSNPDIQFYIDEFNRTQDGDLRVFIWILPEPVTVTDPATGIDFTYDMTCDCSVLNQGIGYHSYSASAFHLVD